MTGSETDLLPGITAHTTQTERLHVHWLESGPPHQQGIAFYQARGSRVDLFKEIVLVRVQTTQPIDSPAYDLGMTEDEVRDRWERHFQSIRGRGTSVPTGE